eukprot:727402-Amphidinium_carterae.1
MVQQRPLLQTALRSCVVIRDVQQSGDRGSRELLQLGGISYLQVLKCWVWPATRHAQKAVLKGESSLKEKRLQENNAIKRPSDRSPGSTHRVEGSSDLSPAKTGLSSPVSNTAPDSSGAGRLSQAFGISQSGTCTSAQASLKGVFSKAATRVTTTQWVCRSPASPSQKLTANDRRGIASEVLWPPVGKKWNCRFTNPLVVTRWGRSAHPFRSWWLSPPF